MAEPPFSEFGKLFEGTLKEADLEQIRALVLENNSPEVAGEVAHLLRPYSILQGHVYDPFVGSGTTIIAAERQGRRCFAVEISPAYCDVVVERWEAYTGKTAKKESGAEP